MTGYILDWMGVLFERDKGLYEDAIPFLESIQDQPRTVISKIGQDSLWQRYKSIQQLIGGYVPQILTVPSKELFVFRNAANRMGLSHSDIVVLDDRPDRGILVGNQLGMTTVRLNRGTWKDLQPNSDLEVADHDISDLQGLLAVLQ